MYKNVEIRKLPAGALCNIVNILEINNDWIKVLNNIPKNPTSVIFEPKYNSEHIRLIEEHSKATNRKCTEILFDEWGTSGMIRPTLETLKDIVSKAGIYRAADEIAVMLNEAPPPRPNVGPAALVDTNVTTILNDESLEWKLNNMDSIKTEHHTINRNVISNNQAIYNRTTVQMKSHTMSQQSFNIPDLNALLPPKESSKIDTKPTEVTELPTTEPVTADVKSESIYQMSLPNIGLSNEIDNIIRQYENLVHFKYAELKNMTNEFADTLTFNSKGPVGKIGSGGFGEVFVGIHPSYGKLAIKRVFNNVIDSRKIDIGVKTFNSEVKYLSQFKHENIVPIIGFSIDGPSLCVVCEYLEGGSLEHKLEAKILNEQQRLKIILGAAEGLKYLHKSEIPETKDSIILPSIDATGNISKNYFVHGDIKSANILLTVDCVPKLCDFGLCKQYDSTKITSSPVGTQGYMAIEGYFGTISQKMDIYAYGVVLLELLTGKKAIHSVNKNETIHIKDYIAENCPNDDISVVLDPVVDKWTKAQEIYNVAKSCVEFERKSRPSIEEVCDILYKIVDKE